MSRLNETLSGGKKLIGFIVGGDPDARGTISCADDVINAGADVLEVGLPFSDPIADGPTIQAGSTRALKGGMNPNRYFRLCERISARHGVPLVCLTYYNMILHYGHENFAASCQKAGIDGVIVPDLPLEHVGPFKKALDSNGVDFIFLVAENTPDLRLKMIAEVASGFIYVVALLGTTGARDSLDPKLKALMKRIRKYTDLPLAIGFGISTPAHVHQAISMGADAAIVGSAIVARHHGGEDVYKYVSRLKRAAE